jgi:hypothetical protein
MPSDAMPDHSQSHAVRSTSSHPPKVKNRMKKGIVGGEATRANAATLLTGPIGLKGLLEWCDTRSRAALWMAGASVSKRRGRLLFPREKRR